MKLGYGLDEETEWAACHASVREKVLEWIRSPWRKEQSSFWMDMFKADNYPMVTFSAHHSGECNVDMAVAKEEAFGPVASLIRCESLEQAIEWINTKTNLGHSAAILTSSGKNARKFIREVNVGNVGVNIGVAQPFAFFPLGSRRESFVGTAKSRMASMRMFMDEKTVCTRWV